MMLLAFIIFFEDNSDTNSCATQFTLGLSVQIVVFDGHQLDSCNETRKKTHVQKFSFLLIFFPVYSRKTCFKLQ